MTRTGAAAVLLAALVAPAACRTPQQSVAEDVAVARTTGALVGTWEGAGVRVVVLRIWPSRNDGAWLYVEEAPERTPDEPERQRVVRLRPGAAGGVRWDAFALPEPRQFAGAWRDDPPFCCIRPDDLEFVATESREVGEAPVPLVPRRSPPSGGTHLTGQAARGDRASEVPEAATLVRTALASPP